MHRASGFNAYRHARSHPYIIISHRNSSRSAEEARSSYQSTRECNICSYTQSYPAEKVPVFHSHFSSARLRELLSVETSHQGFYCPSCKSRHRPYIDERLKVTISDSTLHDFFAPRLHTDTVYEGDLVHVDYVTIAGGTLPDLLHAFRLDYEATVRPKPLDVLLVAGYDDLYQGFGRDYIWRGINKFSETVLKLSRSSDTAAKNTFAVASLMYPPKICWFRDDGPTPNNYDNQKEKVDWLNEKIDRLNRSHGVYQYPGFHSYGVRMGTKLTKNENGQLERRQFKAHRWDQWVEPARRDKSTLKAERLFKMGKAVNNYFLYQT